MAAAPVDAPAVGALGEVVVRGEGEGGHAAGHVGFGHGMDGGVVHGAAGPEAARVGLKGALLEDLPQLVLYGVVEDEDVVAHGLAQDDAVVAREDDPVFGEGLADEFGVRDEGVVGNVVAEDAQPAR